MAEDTESVNSIEDYDKEMFRDQIWILMEMNHYVAHPSPFKRIPNFNDITVATRQLLLLDEFRSARCVQTTWDLPMEPTRALTIDCDKMLYIRLPSIDRNTFLKQISFCSNDKPLNAKAVVTRWGIETFSRHVDTSRAMHIDVIVVGSVAVSRQGMRIGQGRGFFDLDFALLREMGIVTDQTTIVTIVHESQIFDSLPDQIVKKHDVPVDYIITAKEIIPVENRLPRPTEIFWDILSPKTIDSIPYLRSLHYCQLSYQLLYRGPSNSRDGVPLHFVTSYYEVGQMNPVQGGSFRRKNFVPYPGNWPRLAMRGLAPGADPFFFSLGVKYLDEFITLHQFEDILDILGIPPSSISWRYFDDICAIHYMVVGQEELSEISRDIVIDKLENLTLNSIPANLLVLDLDPIPND